MMDLQQEVLLECAYVLGSLVCIAHTGSRYGSKIEGQYPVKLKGMRSNVWSNSTLLRGVRAVDSQPANLLSSVKLEQDAEAVAALQESCHCITCKSKENNKAKRCLLQITNHCAF